VAAAGPPSVRSPAPLPLPALAPPRGVRDLCSAAFAPSGAPPASVLKSVVGARARDPSRALLDLSRRRSAQGEYLSMGEVTELSARLDLSRLDVSGICALLWLLSRSPSPPASLVSASVSRLDALSASVGGDLAISRLGAGRLSKALSSLVDLSPLHRAPVSLVSRLCDAVAAHSSDFGAQHASTSLWALGQLGAREQTVALSALCGALFRARGDLRVTNASNCLWALARLGFRGCGAETLAALEACLARGAPLSGRVGASATYALGSLRQGSASASSMSPGLAACVDALSREGASLPAPGAAANALWGLAQLRLPKAACGAAVSSLARNSVLSTRGTASDVSTAVCSLAHLGHACGAALDLAVESRAPLLSARHVSDVLWAYARTGHSGGAVAAGSDVGVDGSSDGVSSRGVDKSQPLFLALDAAVVRTAPTMSGRDAAVAVWSYGKLGRLSESALGALARALCRLDSEQPRTHSAQNMSVWLVSLARLSFVDTDALRVVDCAVERCAHAMGPQALANSLWGYATLRRGGSEGALRALDAAIARSAQQKTFSAQHVALVMWAYAFMSRQSEALPVLELAIARHLSTGDISSHNAGTVHSALLRLVNDQAQAGAAYALRDATLFARLSALFQDSSAKPKRTADYDTNNSSHTLLLDDEPFDGACIAERKDVV
jgi:hypothetical protein